MIRILSILIFLHLCFMAGGQNTLKVLAPAESIPVNINTNSEKDIERRNQLNEKKELTRQEQEELQVLNSKYDETIESVWDIVGRECSWYCGGGNYAVKASSSLPKAGSNGYHAESANDLSYKTAWVEGREDEGIGEYLDYYFKNKSPRLTKIIVLNGYMKSEDVWLNNNRVKELKLYVNGKPYAVLQLADNRNNQVFEVGTLGRNKNGTDLILRFEITAVYKGRKYNDTAITEIYFDGIDVH